MHKGKYGSIVCPVTIPTSDGKGVIDLVHNVAYITKGSKAEKTAVPAADAGHVEDLRAELMEAAAGATEELMEKFFETMELEEADIIEGLKVGVKERAVEAGVIVVSAKDTAETVAVGAQRSWKYLKKAELPVMFCVSKCNEEHGDYFKALETLKGKYGSIVCPVTIPTSDGKGVIDLVHNVAYMTNGAKVEKATVPAADAGHVEDLRMELMETAAGATEELMEKFFETMELDNYNLLLLQQPFRTKSSIDSG